MEPYTFINLIIETFEKVKEPLTPEEIWTKAVGLGIDKQLGSVGKTPWATIGARLYTSIKENPDASPFIIVTKRPTKFFLKSLNISPAQISKVIEKQAIEKENKESKSTFHERDLHPLLANFVYSDPHFNCYAKTIFHEKSNKKVKGQNEWLHPDVVGVYFPFKDLSIETQKLQNAFKINSFKIFAFELKISIDFSNLRQCFFQTVSNASWANEGYLVVLRLDEDPEFRNELQRLNNSFGIGIIQLNATAVEESTIVFPAKFKDDIDWETVNRLSEDNPDFKEFILNLTEDIQVGKVKSKYDDRLSEDGLKNHILNKKINNN